MSLHGALNDLGFGPAASCSDCHGAHNILAVDDPRSPVAPGPNRVATCRTCHEGAPARFALFQPHADHEDAERYPLLHAVFLFMELLIYSVFAFFGVHTVLWFLRALVHVLRHGRPAQLSPGQTAYVRFAGIHRLLHLLVILSFLGLSATGLPLKFHPYPWAHVLARALGGFESSSTWHRICAVITIFYFLTHVVWLTVQAIKTRRAGQRWLPMIFGPDSPVPRPRDFADMARMFRWFLGLGPKPTFDRWTYWEKFDYWAVFWGVAIIGSSGLLLWFPTEFTRLLPGWVLNIAKVVHSEEALLATSFIFAIHFFGTHLRPDKFPMDLAVLTGLVTEHELREERPEWYERLRAAGKLEKLKARAPSPRSLFWIRAGGFAALAIGVGLLVGILQALW